jgi:hypothetical protein
MSKIWLEVRQESRIFLESYFVLVTSMNSLSKYGNFQICFPQNIGVYDVGVGFTRGHITCCGWQEQSSEIRI